MITSRNENALNILLLSCGDADYDGRLRSLYSVCNSLGNTYLFSRGKTQAIEQGRLCNSSFLSFVRASIQFAKSIGSIDLLFIDNRKAIIPGILIRSICKPKHVIQDCRELYLFREVKSFSSRIGCLFEKYMARRADIVVCANEERAEIMKREYGLRETPLVYENLRKLKYSSEEGYEKAKTELSTYLNNRLVKIISSSGCSISRTNDVLVENLKKVKEKCVLFLVGNNDKYEEQFIKELATKDANNEVVILGQLDQDNLKYLISQCHIGIVNYGQYDTNNKLCASGKLYEFIYEGKPVVTTTNPPLKRLCSENEIGVADDEYYKGINTVIEKYDDYVDRINQFTLSHTIEDNDKEFCFQIKKRIEHLGC